MEQDPLYNKDPDALVTAACCGDYEIVERLVEEGADLNVKDETGKTAVIAAADEGWLGITEYLLEHGADVNAKDNDGDTALDIAKFQEHDNIVEVLLRFGARGASGPSAKEKRDDEIYEGMAEANKFRDGECYGNELVIAACNGDLGRCKEILTLPVEEGGLGLLRVLGKDNQGNSALHLAAKNGHTEIVKLFLESGMGAEGKNSQGKAPLELARENGHQEMVDLIKFFKNKGN
jgi:uncharacterized protein